MNILPFIGQTASLPLITSQLNEIPAAAGTFSNVLSEQTLALGSTPEGIAVENPLLSEYTTRPAGSSIITSVNSVSQRNVTSTTEIIAGNKMEDIAAQAPMGKDKVSFAINSSVNIAADETLPERQVAAITGVVHNAIVAGTESTTHRIDISEAGSANIFTGINKQPAVLQIKTEASELHEEKWRSTIRIVPFNELPVEIATMSSEIIPGISVFDQPLTAQDDSAVYYVLDTAQLNAIINADEDAAHGKQKAGAETVGIGINGVNASRANTSETEDNNAGNTVVITTYTNEKPNQIKSTDTVVEGVNGLPRKPHNIYRKGRVKNQSKNPLDVKVATVINPTVQPSDILKDTAVFIAEASASDETETNDKRVLYRDNNIPFPAVGNEDIAESGRKITGLAQLVIVQGAMNVPEGIPIGIMQAHAVVEKTASEKPSDTMPENEQIPRKAVQFPAVATSPKYTMIEGAETVVNSDKKGGTDTASEQAASTGKNYSNPINIEDNPAHANKLYSISSPGRIIIGTVVLEEDRDNTTDTENSEVVASGKFNVDVSNPFLLEDVSAEAISDKKIINNISEESRRQTDSGLPLQKTASAISPIRATENDSYSHVNTTNIIQNFPIIQVKNVPVFTGAAASSVVREQHGIRGTTNRSKNIKDKQTLMAIAKEGGTLIDGLHAKNNESKKAVVAEVHQSGKVSDTNEGRAKVIRMVNTYLSQLAPEIRATIDKVIITIRNSNDLSAAENTPTGNTSSALNTTATTLTRINNNPTGKSSTEIHFAAEINTPHPSLTREESAVTANIGQAKYLHKQNEGKSVDLAPQQRNEMSEVRKNNLSKKNQPPKEAGDNPISEYEATPQNVATLIKIVSGFATAESDKVKANKTPIKQEASLLSVTKITTAMIAIANEAYRMPAEHSLNNPTDINLVATVTEDEETGHGVSINTTRKTAILTNTVPVKKQRDNASELSVSAVNAVDVQNATVSENTVPSTLENETTFDSDTSERSISVFDAAVNNANKYRTDISAVTAQDNSSKEGRNIARIADPIFSPEIKESFEESEKSDYNPHKHRIGIINEEKTPNSVPKDIDSGIKVSIRPTGFTDTPPVHIQKRKLPYITTNQDNTINVVSPGKHEQNLVRVIRTDRRSVHGVTEQNIPENVMGIMIGSDDNPLYSNNTGDAQHYLSAELSGVELTWDSTPDTAATGKLPHGNSSSKFASEQSMLQPKEQPIFVYDKSKAEPSETEFIPKNTNNNTIYLMQSTARKNKTITQNMLDMPLQISNESLPPANSNVSSVDLITPIFTGEGIIHDALPQANDNIQHISDYDDNTLLTAGRNNSDNISRAPQIEHSFVKADYEGGNIGYDQFEKIPVTTNEKSAVTHTGTKYHVVYTEEKLANNPAYTVGKTHNNLSSGIRKVRFSGDAEIPGQITHEHPTTAINIPANDNLSSQLSPAILPFGNENVLRNNIMENNNLDTNSNGRKQRPGNNQLTSLHSETSGIVSIKLPASEGTVSPKAKRSTNNTSEIAPHHKDTIYDALLTSTPPTNSRNDEMIQKGTTTIPYLSESDTTSRDGSKIYSEYTAAAGAISTITNGMQTASDGLKTASDDAKIIRIPNIGDDPIVTYANNNTGFTLSQEYEDTVIDDNVNAPKIHTNIQLDKILTETLTTPEIHQETIYAETVITETTKQQPTQPAKKTENIIGETGNYPVQMAAENQGGIPVENDTEKMTEITMDSTVTPPIPDGITANSTTKNPGIISTINYVKNKQNNSGIPAPAVHNTDNPSEETATVIRRLVVTQDTINSTEISLEISPKSNTSVSGRLAPSGEDKYAPEFNLGQHSRNVAEPPVKADIITAALPTQQAVDTFATVVKSIPAIFHGTLPTVDNMLPVKEYTNTAPEAGVKNTAETATEMPTLLTQKAVQNKTVTEISDFPRKRRNSIHEKPAILAADDATLLQDKQIAPNTTFSSFGRDPQNDSKDKPAGKLFEVIAASLQHGNEEALITAVHTEYKKRTTPENTPEIALSAGRDNTLPEQTTFFTPFGATVMRGMKKNSPVREYRNIDIAKTSDYVMRLAGGTASGGHSAAVLHLRPESLGGVTLSVAVQGNTVGVTIGVETAEAQQAVAAQLSSLRDLLTKNGMTVHSIEVLPQQQDTARQPTDGHSQQNGGNAHEDHSQRQAYLRSFRAAAEPREATVPAHRTSVVRKIAVNGGIEHYI